jgi:hypothetical protein
MSGLHKFRLAVFRVRLCASACASENVRRSFHEIEAWQTHACSVALSRSRAHTHTYKFSGMRDALTQKQRTLQRHRLRLRCLRLSRS